MLVVTRFEIPEAEAASFLEQARAALAAFRGRPGYLRGRLGRSVDDPTAWLLSTEWDSVGAYRRSLSSYEVKVEAAPLLAWGRNEASAFEVLVRDEGTRTEQRPSSRAADAARTGIGRSAGPAGTDLP